MRDKCPLHGLDLLAVITSDEADATFNMAKAGHLFNINSDGSAWVSFEGEGFGRSQFQSGCRALYGRV